MIYVLDTNAIIWYLAGDPLLSAAAREIIDDPGDNNRLAVSTIAFVEAWERARKERRQFVPIQDVIRMVRTKDLLVADLTLTTVQLLPDLWEDSRDMIIIATALDLQARYGAATIVSSDRKMRSDQSLIPCIW